VPEQQPASSAWGSSYRLIAAEKWKAKSAAMGRGVTEAIAEYAEARPGMKVLDVATGTGEPGITLAKRVLPDGWVTAVDLSPELLEIAAERARQRNLTNFETRQADAHQLPLDSHVFDLATCRFGVMFFARAEEALREVRRVLKPGARACFAAWGSFEQPYWQSTMKIAHQHAGGTLFEAGATDPFRFSEAGSLSKVLRSAGFHEVEESLRDVPWVWPGTADEVFEYASSCSTPFKPMLARIPEEKRPEMLANARVAIERFRVGDEIRFGAKIVLASGKA